MKHISIRLAFNLTLFITGVFALSGGASPNSITLCSLAAVWSIGVGGNLPVDSAIFLGMSGVTIGAPTVGSLVVYLWDFNYRIYTGDTPISTDGLVCLVGSRPTPW